MYRADYSLLGIYWDNGKENGNYSNRVIYGLGFRVLGLYWENGKDNGDYNNGLYIRDYRVYIGVYFVVWGGSCTEALDSSLASCGRSELLSSYPRRWRLDSKSFLLVRNPCLCLGFAFDSCFELL